jgi:O-antigen ligase
VALGRGELLSQRQRHLGPLLGGLGAALLFVSASAVTAEGKGAAALALLVAAVGGVVAVARPELGVLALTSTFLVGYFGALEGEGRFTLNNLLGLLLLGILLARTYGERDPGLFADGHLLLFGIVGAVFVANQVLTASFRPPGELAALDVSEVRVEGFVSKIAYLLFVIAFIRTRAHVLMLAFAVVALVLMTVPNAIWNALAASGDIEKVRASADFGILAASNANRLAFVCAIALAIIGFGMREVRSWMIRGLGAASIGLLVVGIVLSASRSGLLNLIVLTLLFVRRTRPRLFAGLALVVLLVGVIAMVGNPGGAAQAVREPAEAARGLLIDVGGAVIPEKYLQRITSLGVSRGEEGHTSTTARLGLLKTGFQAFLEHPWVGIGVGNFRWVAIADYQAERASALHNSYLLALVEGGLLLFIPYVALYAHTWRSLQRSRRLATAHPEVRLGWLVEAMHAIFVMFLVFSVFADLWHDVYPFLIVAFTAALAGIYRRVEGAAPSRPAST